MNFDRIFLYINPDQDELYKDFRQMAVYDEHQLRSESQVTMSIWPFINYSDISKLFKAIAIADKQKCIYLLKNKCNGDEIKKEFDAFIDLKVVNTSKDSFQSADYSFTDDKNINDWLDAVYLPSITKWQYYPATKSFFVYLKTGDTDKNWALFKKFRNVVSSDYGTVFSANSVECVKTAIYDICESNVNFIYNSAIVDLVIRDECKFFYWYTGSGNECINYFSAKSIEETKFWFTKSSYNIIIGNSSGIETETLNDIYIIARGIMKLSKMDADTLMITIQNSKEAIFKCSFTSMTVNIILYPSIKYFKTYFGDIVCSGLNRCLKFYFCGHGTFNGEICFSDGDLSGTQFKQFISELILSHQPDIQLILNCCYAFKFCGQIDSNMTKVQLATPMGIDYDENLDNEKDIEQDRALLLGMIATLGDRSFHQLIIGNTVCHITPLSFGLLKATGLLLEMASNSKSKFNIIPNCSNSELICNSDVLKNTRAKIQKLSAKSFLNSMKKPLGYTSSVTSPKLSNSSIFIKVFQAKNGDSAAINFFGKLILIDGGLSVDYVPCFLEFSKNYEVEYAILTHGDQDHISGFKNHAKARYFALNTAKQNKNSTSFIPYKVNNWLFSTSINYYRYFKDVAELSMIIKGTNALAIRNFKHHKSNIISPIFKKKRRCFNIDKNEHTLRIHCISPKPEDHKSVQTQVEQYRRLSQINKTGLVVFVQIKNNTSGEIFNMLFTGDADGADIVANFNSYLTEQHDCVFEAYKELSEIPFYYVDVPHHGAKSNNTKVLLDALKSTKYLSISTNGGRHNHPDIEVLNEIVKCEEKFEQLMFNYDIAEEKKMALATIKTKVNYASDIITIIK